MAVTTPPAPALPEELTALLRRMRLPYLRNAAPDVLADRPGAALGPRETLRVLLDEEVRGRDAATRAQRRRAAGLPARKTLASWREHDSSIPAATQHALATLEWLGRAENLAVTGPAVIHGLILNRWCFRWWSWCCDRCGVVRGCCWLSGPAPSGEFAPEVEVLAVGLFEGGL